MTKMLKNIHAKISAKMKSEEFLQSFLNDGQSPLACERGRAFKTKCFPSLIISQSHQQKNYFYLSFFQTEFLNYCLIPLR